MDSVGYPRGLIRYDSETNIASDHPHPPRLAWKSLKVIGYATALVLMTAVLGYNIGTRSNLEVNVQQVRQPLYVMLSDGSFRNRYVIHIVNKTESDEIYAIDVEGISPKALDMHYFRAVSVKAGKGLNMNATVNLSAEDALKVSKFNFVVTPASTKEAVKIEASFNSQRDQH
jgi:polyferredoxin